MKNQKGIVSPLVLVLVAFVVVVAAFIVVKSQETEETSTNTAAAPASSTTTDTSTETSTPESEVTLKRQANIDLEAVSGYDASGTAIRAEGLDGRYTHQVFAKIQNPAPGKFYEGWIVGPSVVSTGKLVNEGGGDWSLGFFSEEDYYSHDQVVITEETEAKGLDGIPETHVLEGSF